MRGKSSVIFSSIQSAGKKFAEVDQVLIMIFPVMQHLVDPFRVTGNFRICFCCNQDFGNFVNMAVFHPWNGYVMPSSIAAVNGNIVHLISSVKTACTDRCSDRF